MSGGVFSEQHTTGASATLKTHPGGSWWPLDEARDDKEVADGPHPRCPPSVKGGIFLYLSVGCQGQPGLRSSVVTQILWDLLDQPQLVISSALSPSVLSVGDGVWGMVLASLLASATSTSLCARLCAGQCCPSLLWGASRALSARQRRSKGGV